MDGSEGIALQTRVPQICVWSTVQARDGVAVAVATAADVTTTEGVQENNDFFHSNRPALCENDSFG